MHTNHKFPPQCVPAHPSLLQPPLKQHRVRRHFTGVSQGHSSRWRQIREYKNFDSAYVRGGCESRTCMQNLAFCMLGRASVYVWERRPFPRENVALFIPTFCSPPSPSQLIDTSICYRVEVSIFTAGQAKSQR